VISLERRYRRLLAWYPKDHRTLYEDEMIAVLLAGTVPGQERPTVRDAFDLLRGGLSIRLHHTVGPEMRRHWRDAFNITAFIAPIAFFLAALIRAALYSARALRGNFSPAETLPALELLAFALPYGLIALLAWHGRPKAAAACAWVWTVLAALITLKISLDLNPDYVASEGLVGIGLDVLPISVCVCAAMLTIAPSPGPAPLRTPQLLGWTAVMLAMWIATIPVSFAWGTLATLLVVVPAITAWLARTGDATSRPAGG
jgi:hypothetical protein